MFTGTKTKALKLGPLKNQFLKTQFQFWGSFKDQNFQDPKMPRDINYDQSERTFKIHYYINFFCVSAVHE